MKAPSIILPSSKIEEDAKKDLEELLSLCKKNIQKVDEGLITKAFWRCFHCHKDQKRASGEPYYTHPTAVARLLLKEIPLDSISIAATLLHDVIEDYNYYSLNDLKKEFGDEIALIVNGLTKISDMFANQEIKEAENFRKMLLSMITDIRIILIKFCDRLHNMQTLSSLPPHRQVKIATQSRDIYALLAHRFGLFNIKVKLEDLAFKYLNPEEYYHVLSKLETLNLETKTLEKAIKPIKKILTKGNFEFTILARQKSIYSIYRKIFQKNRSLNKIYDIYGIRVILKNDEPSDCYAVYGYITYRLFNPIPERFKDYIARPKKNGYQSLHAALLMDSGQVFEIQIRTQRMHDFAENGIAAHWRYKENISTVDRGIEKMIGWAKDLLENETSGKTFMEHFRINLEHNDIYVFTPKGEVKVLPKGSTVLDFAFDIHTEIGTSCIGGKISSKIVSIKQKLNSGDQVEILTSKKQKPTQDWEKYVVTTKAKSNIRQALNEDRRKFLELGKEIWLKLIKKKKYGIGEPDLPDIIKFCGVSNQSNFFIFIGTNEISIESVVRSYLEKTNLSPTSEKKTASLEKPKKEKEKSLSSSYISPIVIDNIRNIAFDYAKCCNPVPGDNIIGLVSMAGIVKVHRRSCKNINNSNVIKTDRLLNAKWNVSTSEVDFLAVLNVFGFDRLGISNELTDTLLKSKVNIKSISLNASAGNFTGSITLYIKDLNQLDNISAKLVQIHGIVNVERSKIN